MATSTTEQVTARSVARADAPQQTCACGQPLECCRTGHCPRCGVALTPTR